jgi:hypothetical protein
MNLFAAGDQRFAQFNFPGRTPHVALISVMAGYLKAQLALETLSVFKSIGPAYLMAAATTLPDIPSFSAA